MIKQEDKTLIMLIGDVHRQFGHKIRELEKKNGFGNCINCILFELEHHNGLTQVELVDKIHMRSSSISVALQKMEQEGLIQRTTKDNDQRYTIVCITEKGKTICKEMHNKIQLMDETLTKKINENELEIAKKVLFELSDSMKGDNNENF